MLSRWYFFIQRNLGEKCRLFPIEIIFALRSMLSRWYFLYKRKGSLTPGKPQNSVSRFAETVRVSRERNIGKTGTLGKKLERKNGQKGKGRGSARHGTGGQAVTEFIVLRCSYTEGRFVPPTMPRSSPLTSRGRLSFLPPLPASVAWTTRGLCLSLSHADPPRTYPLLFVSVTGKWPLQTGTTILHSLSLSLSLFRFHLLSPYNSPTAFIKSRVYLWKREGERGLIVAGKIGERTNTGVSALLFLSLSLSVSKSTRSFAFRSSNASLLRGTISCTCSC